MSEISISEHPKIPDEGIFWSPTVQIQL